MFEEVLFELSQKTKLETFAFDKIIVAQNGRKGKNVTVNSFLQYLNSFFISLSNNNILDVTKLKSFADNKLKMVERKEYVLDRGEKIVGNWRKCWSPAFSPFLQCFHKATFLGSLKRGIVW